MKELEKLLLISYIEAAQKIREKKISMIIYLLMIKCIIKKMIL
jgi:hypothetical protein